MTIPRRAVLGAFTAAPLVLPNLAAARGADRDAWLDAAFAEDGPPAIAAAVVGRQGLEWSGVRGVRALGETAPATLKDRWHLGSNTKAMTAALYARLVDQGRMAHGATLAELFAGAEIHPALAAVTADDLMNHRAGLLDRELITREVLVTAHGDQRPLREQRAAFAASTLAKVPGGAPGSFAYSNAGYALIGAAIEQALGQTWEDALTTEIFQPLELPTAGFGAPQGDEPRGHRSAAGGATISVDPARGDNPAFMRPGGGTHMSVADYARWLQVWLSGGEGLLSSERFRHLTTPPAGEGRPYAHGWIINPSDPLAGGTRSLAHEGSNTLWHAIALVAPEQGRAVFALSNDFAKGAPAGKALAARLMQEV
ncbi:class A beta-lactamase-related serine hydrolase [Brevundimonas sp. S30B]|uniref:serine hydrolase domain-containing protein n=1 Tax=unclassified Brevundimonas TaxID=2622653 RepID=UPI001071B5DC|nr:MULTISPECIES: serine hydrolase domain-containing protein [unclassified Brevundimonas]QBX38580.1 class A beta-lactamase-related serine hydrolase [Brevundimonas sp. MF30-B]TFW00470.1 class A beta-lactamase-related serine hydrolase [Brevundimonas sp. S30B]TFW01883.1 class A beta-lactamase-related serine hydrolase [Brevundimonas sp. S30B]